MRPTTGTSTSRPKNDARGNGSRPATPIIVTPRAYYWYCGRSDDMLKVGGLWVSPIENRNTLWSIQQSWKAAVIGGQDADGPAQPKAYVLLKSEFTASVQLQTDLQSHVKSKLAPYKYPRWVSLSTICQDGYRKNPALSPTYPKLDPSFDCK